jgi:hypothetical protein
MGNENHSHEINRPLYFNTTSNIIHVVENANTTNHPQNNDLNVYNLAGQLCFKTLIPATNTIDHSIQIPANLSAGTYIAQYKNYSIKIILTDNR